MSNLVHVNIRTASNGLVTIHIAAGTNHWAHKYPHLAAFMAGDMAENSGPDAVNDTLMASDEEAQQAERQLEEYDYRICYAMGYHKLVPSPASLPEGEVFMGEEIVNRYY